MNECTMTWWLSWDKQIIQSLNFEVDFSINDHTCPIIANYLRHLDTRGIAKYEKVGRPLIRNNIMVEFFLFLSRSCLLYFCPDCDAHDMYRYEIKKITSRRLLERSIFLSQFCALFFFFFFHCKCILQRLDEINPTAKWCAHTDPWVQTGFGCI